MAKAPGEFVSRSGRVPASLEPNSWSVRLAERRRAGGSILDLTEMNPTRTGLSGVSEDSSWEVLRAALADPRAARYEPDPRGLRSAREAVAELYGGAITPDQVTLTSGTSESYAHLFRVLADPGERVLVPRPSYPLFEPIAVAEGVRALEYSLGWERGRWRVQPGSLASRVARSSPRAIVLVQPNIPTGSALDAEEIDLLERLAVKGSAAIISDEVFAEFGRSRAAPIPSLVGSRAVPTFVLGGLSKSCGLPQLKLGWIVACGPREPVRALLEGLEWVSDLFLSVATPVQLALPGLLASRHAFQERVRRRIAENLERLDAVARQVPALRALPADGGWAAILLLPPQRTGEEWALSLLDRDVAVHPDEFYDLDDRAVPGERGSAVVVSLIPEPHTFCAGIERLAEHVARA